MKTSFFIFLAQLTLGILSVSVSTAQILPFFNGLALDPMEPNAAYHLESTPEEILISGQYFSQEEGYWLPFVVKLDQEGNFISKTEFKNDTSYLHSRPEYVYLTENNYTFYGSNDKSYLFTYHLESESIDISSRFDFFTQDIGPESFLISEDRNRTYYCGKTLQSDFEKAIIYEIKNNNLREYTYGIAQRDTRFLNMRINSKDHLIAIAQNGWGANASMYIIAFDKEFNLLYNTSISGNEKSFLLQKGMVIDDHDNIICTGLHITKPNEDFIVNAGVTKLNSNGEHLWTSTIGNTNHYSTQYPEWNSVTLSSQNDGYILAGSVPYQSESMDTSIRIPTIGKVSLSGDSLWYYQYSYRSSSNVTEAYHDIVTTSDGGYAAVGTSILSDAMEDELPWLQSIVLKVNSKGTLDVETSSIVELKMKNLNVYPNPSTTDFVYIKGDYDGQLFIEVLDFDGKIMDNFTLLSIDHTVILDVTKYPTGIYHIRGDDKQGTQVYSSFIKN